MEKIKEEIDELKEYREKLSKLSEEELKKRDLYLKKLANGTIQGPPTGFASIDKQWLKHYDENSILMPSKKKLSAYEYMKENNKHNLDKIALSYFNIKYTYDELLKNIDETMKALIYMGVNSGEKVIMISANTPENTFLFYALNKIGAVPMIVDPRLNKEEINSCINDISAKKIFILDISGVNEKIDFFKTNIQIEKIVTYSAVESLSQIVKTINNIKSKSIKEDDKIIKWSTFLKNGEKIDLNNYSFHNNDECVIVRTGGTTGKPKSVVLTNDNMNEMAYQHKIGDYNFEKGDTFLNFLPPFIAYGICAALHMPLCLSLNNILIPTFDADEFPKLMKKYKPNVVFGGPILYEKMLTSKYTKDLDMSFFKVPVSGGDVMNPELEKRINAFLKSHGCVHSVGQGYGMTEIASSGVYSKENSIKPGSVGIPLIRNVVSVFDVNSGRELNIGQEGEICFKTGTMMKEYLNNSVETQKVIRVHDDGSKWIHTGDIGKIDVDGNIYLLGRIKRMIVSNGSKIFPSTIENIISKNDNIESCAVVGMDDKIVRKVPVAHIVLKHDMSESELNICIYQILKQIKKELPDFYVPATFVVRKEMPLTSINKIDFKTLETELYSTDVLVNYKEIMKIK